MITKMTQDNNEVTLFKRECAKEGDCSNSCTDPDEQMKDVVCDSCCEEDLCNKGEGPVPEAAKNARSIADSSDQGPIHYRGLPFVVPLVTLS